MSETKETIDQSILAVRVRLESIFQHFDTANSVVSVSVDNLKHIVGEPDVATVLMRNVSDAICTQLEELLSVIELLGGKTNLTGHRDDAEEEEDDNED